MNGLICFTTSPTEFIRIFPSQPFCQFLPSMCLYVGVTGKMEVLGRGVAVPGLILFLIINTRKRDLPSEPGITTFTNNY